MQRIRGVCGVLPIRKPFVARAHLQIGDERGHTPLGQDGEIRFALIARVRRQHRRARAERRQRVYDGEQQFLFGPGPLRVRVDDDLMVRIDGRHAGVALIHALVRGHLRALVLRAIALGAARRSSHGDPPDAT